MKLEILHLGNVIEEVDLPDLNIADLQFAVRIESKMANGKEEYIRLPKVSRVPHEPTSRKRGQYLSSLRLNFRDRS